MSPSWCGHGDNRLRNAPVEIREQLPSRLMNREPAQGGPQHRRGSANVPITEHPVARGTAHHRRPATRPVTGNGKPRHRSIPGTVRQLRAALGAPSSLHYRRAAAGAQPGWDTTGHNLSSPIGSNIQPDQAPRSKEPRHRRDSRCPHVDEAPVADRITVPELLAGHLGPAEAGSSLRFQDLRIVGLEVQPAEPRTAP